MTGVDRRAYVPAATNEGMWYQRAGSGPPVVCVHGWCLNGDLWTYLHASLADSYDMLLVDLPGFGRSGHLPGPYTIDRHADAVLALLGEASLQGAVLVGFAYGGAVVMRAAARDPSRIAGLVGVGVPRAGTLPDERMLASMSQDWPRYAQRSAEALVPGGGREDTVDWLTEVMAATPPEVAQESWRDLSGFDPVPVARTLDLPTLFIHGADDSFAPLTAAEESAAVSGGTLRVISDAGHLVVFDRPDEFRQELVEFVSNLEVGRQ